MNATMEGTDAFALAEMLRIRLDADFEWKLDRFGRPCRITPTRTPWRKA